MYRDLWNIVIAKLLLVNVRISYVVYLCMSCTQNNPLTYIVETGKVLCLSFVLKMHFYIGSRSSWIQFKCVRA